MDERNQSGAVDEFDLAQFDGDYAAAEVEKKEPIPDGKYHVSVERAELTRSKTSDKPMLKWTLRVCDGPHEGRYLWRYNLIVTPENIKWLKTDLHTCGVEIEKLSDLPDHLEGLLDLKLEVTKRTRDENENVYLNRRVELPDGYDAAAERARGQF